MGFNVLQRSLEMIRGMTILQVSNMNLRLGRPIVIRDREFVTDVVIRNGRVRGLVTWVLRYDREVVVEAVKKKGNALNMLRRILEKIERLSRRL